MDSRSRDWGPASLASGFGYDLLGAEAEYRQTDVLNPGSI